MQDRTLKPGFYWAEWLTEGKVVVIEWVGGFGSYALAPGSGEAFDISAFRVLSPRLEQPPMQTERQATD